VGRGVNDGDRDDDELKQEDRAATRPAGASAKGDEEFCVKRAEEFIITRRRRCLRREQESLSNERLIASHLET
jgi:hypothetical protein